MKWLANENFRSAIVRGIRRQVPAFDIARAQDVPAISGKDDLAILRYATAERRVVVTHDLSTMIPAMRDQIRLASRCAPIVLVPDSVAISTAIQDLLLIDQCAIEADWTRVYCTSRCGEADTRAGPGRAGNTP